MVRLARNIENYILEFETEGLKPFFQELMYKNYYPKESIMTYKDNILRCFIEKKSWFQMGEEGIIIMSDNNNLFFENAIEEIKRVDSKFKIEGNLTRNSLIKLFLDLKSAAKNYGFFNMAYFEKAYKYKKEGLILTSNLQKVEKLKENSKKLINNIFFANNSHWESLINVISKKFLINEDILKFYLEEEILQLFLGHRLSNNEILQRKKSYVFDRKNKFQFLQGKKAEEYILKFNKNIYDINNLIISGMVSNVGCGIIKGKVKVININYEEFEKTNEKINDMEMGDILVSRTTDPSLIKAYKKASAVLTDVGGMLSHAAIMARELNIPGIVGIKIATKVLKDGDLVEVDTNKGIVKILNKNKK